MPATQAPDWMPMAIVLGAILAAVIAIWAVAAVWRDLKTRNSRISSATKIIDDAGKRAEELMRPIADLTLPIIAVSWGCAQIVFPRLKLDENIFKTSEEQKMYIYCEFLYFSCI